MEFKKFIENYWEIFLKHICQFHPLDRTFLTEYVYELDWKLISKNRRIDWTQELLETFEDRYLWHELAWNESISWDSALIKRFKKRLDWYYLGRNTNLPISAQFIEEHKKSILIMETNNFLTEELRKLYGKELLPVLKPKKAPITELTKNQLVKLEETILTGENIMNNTFKNLYKEYILPNLDLISLQYIFKTKFDYSQRYFKLRPIRNDIHGLTPEFTIKGKNVFGDFREGRGLFDIQNQLKLVNGSLQEGPPRLYEVPRFSDLSYYPILLISQNVKSVLEKFKISTYKFIPVKISPKKIKTDLQFYLLQVEYDSLLKKAAFKDLVFQKLTKNKWFSEFKAEKLKKGAVKSYESISILREESKSQGIQYCKFVPLYYEVNTDEDIFTIEHDIIVNEFVKNAIEDILPNQALFESVQTLNIKIPQEYYNAKRKNEFSDDMPIVSLDAKISEAFIFYSDKAIRLEREDEPFVDQIIDDEFRQKQIDLNVIIPESFKSRYRGNQIDTEGYELLPIREFYTQNEYSDRIPETYKSIVIAENGAGDSLGLILEKEDDYKLRDELYEFNHETGEVEKY